MKWLFFLLSLYILLLPCLPCSEAESDTVSVATIQAGKESNGPDDHHPSREACNPFCSCTCCGHILLQPFQLNRLLISRPAAGEKKVYTCHSFVLPADRYGNIWQPPRFDA